MSYELHAQKGPRMKIKVTNLVDKRVDIHIEMTKWDISWIKSNPNLKVEVLEVRTGRRKQRR